MKYLFTICLLMGALSLYAQTTMEEYNYLSKGYKIQQESGLDMKKGYRLESVGDWSRTTTQGFSSIVSGAEYLFLLRDGETIPCATLMILKRKGDSDKYYCIPHLDSDEEIWDLATKAILSSKLITFESAGYVISMAKMISHMASTNAYMKPGSAKAYGPDR